MYNWWQEYIRKTLNYIKSNSRVNWLIVVSGHKIDQEYWHSHFTQTTPDVFGPNHGIKLFSLKENVRKGNFLGILNAWMQIKEIINNQQLEFPLVIPMSMVFGKGKRLSPFTQAMHGRKSAFPTPLLGSSGFHLNTAEISILYSNLIIQQLEQSGFRGVFIKWGDEMAIPGIKASKLQELSHVHVIRFAGNANISPDIAREKEWFVVNKYNGEIEKHYPRQEMNAILDRFEEIKQPQHDLQMNLGSVALSYEFLDHALDVFKMEVLDPVKWMDSDPYVWVALLCKDYSEWEKERLYERLHCINGIKDIEERFPDFFTKIEELRERLNTQKDDSFKIQSINFGDILWVDLGLHKSLWQNLEAMLDDSDTSRGIRDIFQIGHDRDDKGNIIFRSNVPRNANISNSIIVDSTITSTQSCINRGIIIGGKHHTIHAPFGGAALFCAAKHMDFRGPRGIAFRFIGEHCILDEGDRLVSVFDKNQENIFRSNEAIEKYDGSNYFSPILGNKLSFNELDQVVNTNNTNPDEAWFSQWSEWQASE